MENIVGDVRNATCLLGMAAANTVFLSDENRITDEIRKRCDLGGHAIYVMTETQANGLIYAIYQVMHLTRQLHDEYYAPFKEKAADQAKAA